MKADLTALNDLFETASLGAPQNAVGFVMWRVMHSYIREVDRVLKSRGVTHLQFTTLTVVAWITRSETAVTQADLSRFADIHPMQVSNVLKALEQKRMIDRTRSDANALAKIVTITATGVDTLRAALPEVIAVQERIFGQAGRPGGTLLRLLVRIDGEN